MHISEKPLWSHSGCTSWMLC